MMLGPQWLKTAKPGDRLAAVFPANAWVLTKCDGTVSPDGPLPDEGQVVTLVGFIEFPTAIGAMIYIRIKEFTPDYGYDPFGFRPVDTAAKKADRGMEKIREWQKAVPEEVTV